MLVVEEMLREDLNLRYTKRLLLVEFFDSFQRKTHHFWPFRQFSKFEVSYFGTYDFKSPYFEWKEKNRIYDMKIFGPEIKVSDLENRVDWAFCGNLSYSECLILVFRPPMYLNFAWKSQVDYITTIRSKNSSVGCSMKESWKTN